MDGRLHLIHETPRPVVFADTAWHSGSDTASARELAGSNDYAPLWYAVVTMPRHEKRVSAHFNQQQIESFLPLYQVKKEWKNRSAGTVDLPLFPNYSFVRIDARERVRVLKVPGVRSIVSSRKELLPVPENYISGLRDGLLAYKIEPHANLEVGEKVRITTGPMAGMEGTLDRQKNRLRVVVILDMIGRSVAVEVGASEISHVGEWPTASPYVARLHQFPSARN